MSRNRKNVNVEWHNERKDNGLASFEVATLEVLMDIRSELRTLNQTLGCYRVALMADAVNRIDKRLVKAGFKLDNSGVNFNE